LEHGFLSTFRYIYRSIRDGRSFGAGLNWVRR
jgi:hypothetical protein